MQEQFQALCEFRALRENSGNAKIRAARKFAHCAKFRASPVAGCTEGSPYETKRNSEVQVKKMSFENVFNFIFIFS